MLSDLLLAGDRPYGGIGPPFGTAQFRDPSQQGNNDHKFYPLYRVLKWLVARCLRRQYPYACLLSRANAGLWVCHFPRVKSGQSTVELPSPIDFSESGLMTLMSTES